MVLRVGVGKNRKNLMRSDDW